MLRELRQAPLPPIAVPTRMDTLAVGDRILAASAHGALLFDEVSRFSIADHHTASVAFLALTLANNMTLEVTAGHHLPVGATCCSSLKQARQLRVGDQVWTTTAAVPPMSPAATGLTPHPLVSIDVTIADGLNNPLMRHGGRPIVNGVVTAFNSITVVTLDSIGVPIAEAFCEAIGACDELRRAVAAVECAAKLLSQRSHPVCKTFR